MASTEERIAELEQQLAQAQAENAQMLALLDEAEILLETDSPWEDIVAWREKKRAFLAHQKETSDGE